MNWRWVWLPAVAVLACAGCTRVKHMFYVYDLDVGVDVAYSQNGNPKLVVGYDRDTFALVPQREDTATITCPTDPPNASPADPTAQAATQRPAAGELMSIAAVSNIVINGLDEFEFDHFVATGQAAAKVSQDPVGMGQIRAAIYGEPAATATPGGH